jgi:hypothetical protein
MLESSSFFRLFRRNLTLSFVFLKTGLKFEQPEKTNWVYFARYELNTIFLR